MKKWLYVISVGSMTAIFLALYMSHVKEADEKDRQRAVMVKQKQDEELAKKKADEAKARVDAEQRAAQRAKEDAEKEAEKRAKWEAAGKKLKDDTAAAMARADKAAKLSAELEIKLDTARKDREKANRESFDTAKLVERAQVDKQNAELENQRLLEMISRRAADSSMTRMPPPPPPPAPK
jgi:hypothetical protein